MFEVFPFSPAGQAAQASKQQSSPVRADPPWTAKAQALTPLSGKLCISLHLD